MSQSRKRTLRLLVIAAAVVVTSLAFLHLSTRSASYAAKCDNTACNSSCWVGGTHHNHGTFAMRTVREPLKCPTGTGGCLTQACP